MDILLSISLVLVFQFPIHYLFYRQSPCPGVCFSLLQRSWSPGDRVKSQQSTLTSSGHSGQSWRSPWCKYQWLWTMRRGLVLWHNKRLHRDQQLQKCDRKPLDRNINTSCRNCRIKRLESMTNKKYSYIPILNIFYKYFILETSRYH